MLDAKKLDYAGAQLLLPVESYKGQTKGLELLNKDIDANITLPEGTELTSVAGIDLPPEDVGHALEFLEFCSAFGKVSHLLYMIVKIAIYCSYIILIPLDNWLNILSIMGSDIMETFYGSYMMHKLHLYHFKFCVFFFLHVPCLSV